MTSNWQRIWGKERVAVGDLEKQTSFVSHSEPSP